MYYTVLELGDDNRWWPQFGDYVLGVARDELRDMAESQGRPRSHFRLVSTPTESQYDIDLVVAKLNEGRE